MIAGAWVCLLAPLGGALAITLAGPWISRRTAGWISTLTTFLAFAGALVALFGLWSRDADERQHLSTAYTWLAAGDFEVGMEILVDPLSVVMMLIVSGVGGLIVWYSMGYMAGDDEERRYFAYMSLFVFSMLLLVQAGNFLLLLVGWGLVGLASYLLIGFWHARAEAVAAAKKAFVMNAVGDATFALALVLLIWSTGTLEFLEVFGEVDGLSDDDGEPRRARPARRRGREVGPDPAAHLAPRRDGGPDAGLRADPCGDDGDGRRVPARAGASDLRGGARRPEPRGDPRHGDAPVAGLVALVQWDIKRVIAYSTMSQIGYMFLGAGIGAYGFAIFHLMTHAFFKALLFLAAGVVIHHLGDEQDIRRMGGLQDSAPADARRLPDRNGRARRIAAVRGLLVEGRDPRLGARRRRRSRLDALRRGPVGDAADRRLLVPALLHGVPGAAAGAGPDTARCARDARRGPALDARAGRRPRRALGDRRPPLDPGCLAPVHALGRGERESRWSRRRPRRTT